MTASSVNDEGRESNRYLETSSLGFCRCDVSHCRHSAIVHLVHLCFWLETICVADNRVIAGSVRSRIM